MGGAGRPRANLSRCFSQAVRPRPASRVTWRMPESASGEVGRSCLCAPPGPRVCNSARPWLSQPCEHCRRPCVSASQRPPPPRACAQRPTRRGLEDPEVPGPAMDGTPGASSRGRRCPQLKVNRLGDPHISTRIRTARVKASRPLPAKLPCCRRDDRQELILQSPNKVYRASSS